VIVEVDSGSILLPTLDRLIVRNYSQNGVSIVNVGHTGLGRFAKIFQREQIHDSRLINIPVACITDMDVMPNCAPEIIGRVKKGESWPEKNKRRWRVEKDFTKDELSQKRKNKAAKNSGQCVKTFVSEKWTLEYDLAYAGLAKDVWICAQLASRDGAPDQTAENMSIVESEAANSFDAMKTQVSEPDELAARVYALFTTGGAASKSITAQYLAERLSHQIESNELTGADLKEKLPPYLVQAIEYATSTSGHELYAQNGAEEDD